MAECWCADYDCAGECCGFGNCTCSTDRDEPDDDAGYGDTWEPMPVVTVPDISLYDAGEVQADTQDGAR